MLGLSYWSFYVCHDGCKSLILESHKSIQTVNSLVYIYDLAINVALTLKGYLFGASLWFLIVSSHSTF